MDVGNNDKKIESVDQALIMFCSLPASYETYVDMLIYGKDIISLEEVSSALKSKVLKKSLPNGKDVMEGESLVASVSSQKRDKKSKDKSKSKKKTIKCFEFHL